MTIAELTLEIRTERLLTEFDSKKLVDWAVNILQLRHESENLYVLAGLDHKLTQEREKYFWKAVKELNIEVEKTKDELIHHYVLSIADKAIKKEIDINYALSQILNCAKPEPMAARSVSKVTPDYGAKWPFWLS